jgi:hypothetical protein
VKLPSETQKHQERMTLSLMASTEFQTANVVPSA